jgi:hypothetical protein
MDPISLFKHGYTWQVLVVELRNRTPSSSKGPMQPAVTTVLLAILPRAILMSRFIALVCGGTECTGLVQHYTPAYESWHHYTVVQEGAYSRLYLDGLLVAMLMYEHSGSYSNNISYVSLGQAKHDGASYGSLNGMMDEVRIWDIALSSDEIEATMYSPLQGNENGLVAYWDFENSTTQALDQSNNGNDGTFMNGASIAAAEYYVPEQLWGDLNEDGHVNISDVILLINHILGAND